MGCCFDDSGKSDFKSFRWGSGANQGGWDSKYKMFAVNGLRSGVVVEAIDFANSNVTLPGQVDKK